MSNGKKGIFESTGSFFMDFFSRIFRKNRDQYYNSQLYLVRLIREKEKSIAQSTREEILGMVEISRQKIQSGYSTFRDEIINIFAIVSEAFARTLNKRLFDVQLVGGIALVDGKVAELRTGEGKTFVVALQSVLFALSGHNIHIVTPNDYLSKRDAERLAPVYNFVGLTVDFIEEGSSFEKRKEAYSANITYGSNNQFAFDYLKDNLVTSADQKMQKELFSATVDEVDNILIDEARTPLIISNSGPNPSSNYTLVNDVMYDLKETDDYILDNKSKNAYLTDSGWGKVRSYLQAHGVDDIFNTNIHLCHFIRNAIKAHKAMIRNRDYVVHNDEIVIIDEFTGRLAVGRRFSNGLHQAIEAKEKIDIKAESITQASISYTAFYKSYKYLCGTTGTGLQDVDEFAEIYDLDVVPIPTNKPILRDDVDGAKIYAHKHDLLNDVLVVVQDCIARRQPILICTTSVHESQHLADLFQKHHVDFNLLNAVNHEKEAYIIAQAGRPGVVTISTRMAGRGTDIPVGGDVDMRVKEILLAHPEADAESVRETAERRCREDQEIALNAGGLLVIIVGAPDSKKTERQIIGRSGRQGQVGKSIKFYSLEDEIIAPLFMDSINATMLNYYFPATERFTVSAKGNEIIDNLQKEYQAYYYDVRKQANKYEKEVNKQRDCFYKYRNHILYSNEKQLTSTIMNYLHFILKNYPNIQPNDLFKVEEFNYSNKYNIPINESYKDHCNFLISKLDDMTENVLREKILNSFDDQWFKHLQELDNLRSTNLLANYKQKDPMHEFNDSCIGLFKDFILKSLKNVLHNITAKSNLFDFSDINFGDADVDESINDLMDRLQNMVDVDMDTIKHMWDQNFHINDSTTDENSQTTEEVREVEPDNSE